jgi:hypothetical protein
MVAALLLVLLGAGLLGQAQALACTPCCCCEASQDGDAPCPELAAVSCCRAGGAPTLPAPCAPAPAATAASLLQAVAVPAAALTVARSSLPAADLDHLRSPHRLSVVLQV